MITITNWDKLTRLFRSQIDISELELYYEIAYYYPTLPSNDYYRITLSRISPPQQDHPHNDEYLILCGEQSRWLSKRELQDINNVYDAIIEVVARHDLKINP